MEESERQKKDLETEIACVKFCLTGRQRKEFKRSAAVEEEHLSVYFGRNEDFLLSTLMDLRAEKKTRVAAAEEIKVARARTKEKLQAEKAALAEKDAAVAKATARGSLNRSITQAAIGR